MPILPDDPFQDPQWLEYADHIRKELIPMIQDSAITMSLVPGDGQVCDPKFAVELGYMIMLDKPIIAIVNPGAKVPPKLTLVADEIVEGDINDPDFQDRLHAAIDRVQAKLKGEEPPQWPFHV